jgi:hypothetical protein
MSPPTSGSACRITEYAVSNHGSGGELAVAPRYSSSVEARCRDPLVPLPSWVLWGGSIEALFGLFRWNDPELERFCLSPI